MNTEKNEGLQFFAYNVTWLKKQYGFSKQKMANILGIGIRAINKLEQGDIPRNVGANAAWNIAEYFNLLPSEFLGRRLGK